MTISQPLQDYIAATNIVDGTSGWYNTGQNQIQLWWDGTYVTLKALTLALQIHNVLKEKVTATGITTTVEDNIVTLQPGKQQQWTVTDIFNPDWTTSIDRTRELTLSEITPTCPSGYHWDSTVGACVQDTPTSSPEPTRTEPCMLAAWLGPNSMDLAGARAALADWKPKTGKSIAWMATMQIFGYPSAPQGMNLIDVFKPLIDDGSVRGIMYSWQPTHVWEPWDEGGVCTAEVANGQYDAYILQEAYRCRTAGYPIIIRFAQEMNGSWAGWGTNPATYIAAWQKIVTIFRNAGATNVKFFWCPNYNDTPPRTFQSYYPGDAYVDYVGIDMYANADTAWWADPLIQIENREFASVYDTYPGKPYIIGEWGCSSTVTEEANATWMNKFFTAVGDRDRIQIITHWKGYDWDIEKHPTAFAEYITRTSNAIYADTLTVPWETPEQNITLTAVAGGGGTVTPTGSLTLQIGQTYLFESTPYPSYNFDHWDLSGSNLGSSPALYLMIQPSMEGQVLTALFTEILPEPITLNITVSGNGTTNPTGPQIFHIGDTVMITAIPQTGATFINWKLDGIMYSTDNPLNLPITADLNGKTLTADFRTATPPTPPFPILVVPVAALLGVILYLATKKK